MSLTVVTNAVCSDADRKQISPYTIKFMPCRNFPCHSNTDTILYLGETFEDLIFLIVLDDFYFNTNRIRKLPFISESSFDAFSP